MFLKGCLAHCLLPPLVREGEPRINLSKDYGSRGDKQSVLGSKTYREPHHMFMCCSTSLHTPLVAKLVARVGLTGAAGWACLLIACGLKHAGLLLGQLVPLSQMMCHMLKSSVSFAQSGNSLRVHIK